MTDPLTVPRRVPTQKRSEQTVQRILDAAGELLGRIPLEFVTTSRIAKEAGISIGALYRFYPDKQSIFDAVAVRHVQHFTTWLEIWVIKPLERDLKGDIAHFNPPKFLEDVIDTYIKYLDENPDFRALALGRLISPGTKERQASPVTGLPSLLKNFMMGRLRIPNTPELDLMLRVVSEAGERLIAFAYEQSTRPERDRVIEEMKRMLTTYLFVVPAR
jgi:AcrR family transcriptional regulator